jgi:hypothetical protein
MTNSDNKIILNYCRNLPKPPECPIPRDHLLEEIRRTLSGKTNLVLLTGEALTGKTEILSQLYQESPSSCIGIFLGSDSYLRSKEYIRLIVAEQISWIVDRSPISADTISETEYQRFIYKLQKHARNSSITWLVDGISNTENFDQKNTQEILSLLPLSARDFSFVLTSEHDISDILKNSSKAPKILDMMLVSPDEAKSYFLDLSLDNKEIQEIRAFCNSSIGRMSIVRSLMQDGMRLDALLEKQTRSLETLFELDWQKITHDTQTDYALAVILFTDRPIFIQELTLILDCTHEQTLKIIEHAKLLHYSDPSSPIAISSRAHRRFASSKLAKFEAVVRQKDIDRLLQSAQTPEAVRYLPSQLAKSGNHELLIKNLNSDHFIKLLEVEKTLRSLRQHADFGREAARQLDDTATEVAFSLISSIMTGLTLSVGRIEQIDAFTRLGLHELALEIASSAPTAEERLHLLARAVSGLDAKGIPISEEMRAQVTQLAEEVDGKVLGELGIDIAHDLLSIDVKLADSFLQQVMDGSEQNSNKEQNLATGLHNEDSPTKDKKIHVGAKSSSFEIPEHKRQMFWRQTGRRIKRLRADHLLRKLKEEDLSFSLLMAKTWLHSNKKHIETPIVANAALDFMLANAQRTPRLADLIDIARPLPYIADLEQRKGLCDRLETQYRTLGHHGTSIESVRLRMQLYRSRYVIDATATELALINLHLEIHSLDELSIRATCWAWMLFHLSTFDNSEQLEKNTDIAALTSTELQSTLDKLLKSSANHFKAAKEALNALNRFDPELGLEIIARLNTEDSRDNAYEEFSRNLIAVHSKHGALIAKAISLIKDDLQRNRAAIHVVLSIRRLHEDGEKDPVAPEILEIWKKIDIAIYRFQALLASAAFEMDAGRASEAKKLKEEANLIWESRPTDWTKVESGYVAARELADADRVAATEWIEKTEDIVNTLRIGSEAAIYALYCTVRLACRLLPSILPSGAAEDDPSLRKISFLASAVPIQELQISIWSCLVVRLHFKGFSKLASHLVDQKISPLLVAGHDFDQCVNGLLIIQSAPALYLTHPASALYRIESLKSIRHKDQARRNIITTILQRTPHQDPSSEDKEIDFWLDAKSVLDITTILRQCQSDSLIFGVVMDLARSLTADLNRPRLQRNVVLDTLNTLESIVKTALPDRRNIQHNGYLIICLGLIQAARSKITRDSQIQVTNRWEQLYTEARSIPNIADRAVVTAYIGINSHVIPSSPVKSWLADVKSDLGSIPMLHDKIGRYDWIGRIIQGKEKVASRNLITDAIKLTHAENQTDDIEKMQRRLIDLAHAIDPRLAENLVETFDSDEARKISLQKQLEKIRREEKWRQSHQLLEWLR